MTGIADPAAPVLVDYLAKDYAGLRQALLDFLPTRLPSWTEQSEADVGIVLLELVASTGDMISYVQDRIANEAFLGSARERRSVAAHLALVDYLLDEGSSATVWLQLEVSQPVTVPAGFRVTAPAAGPGAATAFETQAPARLDPSLNVLRLEADLAIGATSAVVAGAVTSLAAGDALFLDDGSEDPPELVELVAAPEPRPAGKQGARALLSWSPVHGLRRSYRAVDTVVHGNLVLAAQGVSVVEELVLPGRAQPRATSGVVVVPPIGPPGRVFRLSAPGFQPGETVDIVASTPDGERVPQASQKADAELGGVVDAPIVTPARAVPGVWSADATGSTSGRTAVACWRVSGPADDEGLPRPRLRLRLRRAPLAYVEGRPQVRVAVDGVPWRQRPSLLQSAPEAEVYRVEVDDAGYGTIVFGRGDAGGGRGRRPPDGSRIEIAYRVGAGAAGNLAAGLLTAPSTPLPGVEAVTNPLPATGGRDPETTEYAKQAASVPTARRVVAVSAADYAAAAQALVDDRGEPLLDGAGAALRWTGSWLTATLTVEPAGSEALPAPLAGLIARQLESSRLAGYDLRVAAPNYLPIDLQLAISVAPGFVASDVVETLRTALRPGSRGAGTGGFFDRTNFGFGDSLAVSALFAAAAAVPGIADVTIRRLAPLDSPHPDVDTATAMRTGFLAVGSDQIVQLDDDPNAPERGRLVLVPQDGGR